MAKTFAQLVTAFEAHTGISGEIDNATLAIWFNDAQEDLAMDFGRIKTVEVVVGEPFLLPEDCIKVIDVEQGGTPLLWDVSPDRYITIAANGAVKLLYRSMPGVAFSGSDGLQTSDLSPVLHRLIPIYAAYMYWMRESEGDSEEYRLGNSWWEKYMLGKQQALQKLQETTARIPDCWLIAD